MTYVRNPTDRLLVTYNCSWKCIFYCINLTVWLESQGVCIQGNWKELASWCLEKYLELSMCWTPSTLLVKLPLDFREAYVLHHIQECRSSHEHVLHSSAPQDHGRHIFGEGTALMCGVIMRDGDWCRMKLRTRDSEGHGRHIKRTITLVKKKRLWHRHWNWGAPWTRGSRELTQQPAYPFSPSHSQPTV